MKITTNTPPIKSFNAQNGVKHDSKNYAFKGTAAVGQDLTANLSAPMKMVNKFIKLQEDDTSLSTMRLGQEIATNWFPKAIFARSLADLSEVSFLEFTENALVYLAPVLLGGMFHKAFTAKMPPSVKDGVLTSAEKLMSSQTAENKKLMPIKAAIAVAVLAVPLAEYSLSYIKNLFTLKLFKQADFNNIANLNKDKKEDVQKQKQVKESAKKHIKLAGGIYAGCLALAALLLTKGKNKEGLQSLSEAILAPGSKLKELNILKKEETAKTINKYFGLDFASKDGKLGMSNGQITACVVVGGFGYFGAAKDRGKQNFKEVLYRFPLVGLYAITGSALFDKCFKPLLKKSGKCNDLFNAESPDGKLPGLNKLDELARKLAKENNTSAEAEFKKIFKQKALVSLTPFLFGIGVMGLFVAGLSRFSTQYRYNKEQQAQKMA